jgi:hypothetical protein
VAWGREHLLLLLLALLLLAAWVLLRMRLG